MVAADVLDVDHVSANSLCVNDHAVGGPGGQLVEHHVDRAFQLLVLIEVVTPDDDEWHAGDAGCDETDYPHQTGGCVIRAGGRTKRVGRHPAATVAALASPRPKYSTRVASSP